MKYTILMNNLQVIKECEECGKFHYQTFNAIAGDEDNERLVTVLVCMYCGAQFIDDSWWIYNPSYSVQ